MSRRLLMTELLYLVPNDRYDRFVETLHRLPGETLSNANTGSLTSIARLLEPGDLKYLSRLARNRLTDPYGRWNPMA
jgi:digeranylgeranylglycerophospholipid reductase